MADSSGEAWVSLPDYFGALNRDFRYQLTAIGQAAAIYICQEISDDNRFKICGGKPGQKISWMITGIRKDAFANEYRPTVRSAKPVGERGKYHHPECFGESESKRIKASDFPVDSVLQSSPVAP